MIFITKTGREIHKNKIKAQGLFAATKLWTYFSIFFTLTERGESGKRDYLQIEHQSMIIGKNWASFFHNIENKKDLCNLFAIFIRKSCFRDINDVSFVIANNVES